VVVAAAGLAGSATTGGTPGAPGSPDEPATFTPRERRAIARLSPLPPVPPDPTNGVADHPVAARLGQRLFFDARLSVNGEVSCATCHDPELGFGDGKTVSAGLAELTRHAPPLWNVGHNRWFFWDGRADTLWSQALGPIEHPDEMGGTRARCAHVVASDPVLRAEYERVFGPLPALADGDRFPPDARPVPDDHAHAHHAAWMAMAPDDRAAVDRVFANLGKAIAAYQRRLERGVSPFDEFAAALARGDEAGRSALSPAAQRGLKLFVGRANCTLCHFTPAFSDGEFHSTGIGPLGGGPLFDTGRYGGITQLQASPFVGGGPFSDAVGDDAVRAREKVDDLVRSSETWGQFKTPTLRNVAETAPYMHQGQLETLEDVIRHYSTLEDAVLPSHHQEQLLVPLNLTEAEIADLAAFLRSLTGRPPDAALLGPREDAPEAFPQAPGGP
jgi:cytochrome c peroxidase